MTYYPYYPPQRPMYPPVYRPPISPPPRSGDSDVRKTITVISIAVGVVLLVIIVLFFVAMILMPSTTSNPVNRNSVSYFDGYRSGTSLVTGVQGMSGNSGPRYLLTPEGKSQVDQYCSTVTVGDNRQDFTAGCHDGVNDALQQWKYGG